MKRVYTHIIYLILLAGMISCTQGKEATESNDTIDSAAIPDGLKVADSWDLDELHTTFSSNSRYSEWDHDKDGFLDEREFVKSFFELWDRNNDGKVSRSEWNTAAEDYGVNAADWSALDPDKDGFLEMVEFDKGILEIGWYNAWDLDKDKLLTDREYIFGVYNLWDTNGDNVLDEKERRLYDYYYVGPKDVY